MGRLYGKGDDIFSIHCEDQSGNKLLKVKCNVSDTKTFARTISLIIDKYSLPLKIVQQGGVNWTDIDKNFDWKS